MDHRDGCVFCAPDEKLFLRSTRFASVILDRHPVAPGHALVVPRRHVASIFELANDELLGLWRLVAWYRTGGAGNVVPDGWNIGVNDGLAAGQTVAHAHVHVIPRRRGDRADPRGGIRWIFPDTARYWD